MYNPKRDDARLDALVERTRKSLGDDAHPPRFIETVRGAGHRLHEYLGEHF
jgi:DNA-binding response OmpR family regulator